MGKIFISYRRKDSQDVAGRIYDRLEAKFGDQGVFKDVDSLPFAAKFPEKVREAIAECDVFLVLIGERWLDIRDAKGRRRLDEVGDYVRLEIEEALQQKLTVLPVLLDGASMPSEDDLPSMLKELSTINALRIRPDPDFKHDVGKLLSIVEALIAEREVRRKEERAQLDRAQLDREREEQRKRAALEQVERERTAKSSRPAASPVAKSADTANKDLGRPFSLVDCWISLVAIVPWGLACYYADLYMPGERSGVAVLLITAAYVGLSFWEIIRWRRKTGLSTPLDEIRKWRRK